MSVDLAVGGTVFVAMVELTRGEIREPSFVLVVDLGRVDNRTACIDGIADTVADFGLFGLELAPVSPADDITLCPHMRCETNEEIKYIPELGYRRTATGYQLMPHRFWVTAQEPRFMRVQHGDKDGKWVTVWLRISLTRLRPGQVGRLPEVLPDALARIVDEEVRALAVEAAAAQAARDSPDSGSGSPGSGSPGSGSPDSGSPGNSGPGSKVHVGAGTGEGCPSGDGPAGPCPADDWRCAPSPGGGRRRRGCRDTDRYATVRHQAAC